MPKIEIRRILCPTDFSEFSRRALEHAVPLARWYGARITALHVLPLVPSAAAAYPVYLDPLTLEPIPKSYLLDRLRGFVAPAHDAGVQTEEMVLEGNVTRTILERASSLEAVSLAFRQGWVRPAPVLGAGPAGGRRE